jgi:hypothetical protein
MKVVSTAVGQTMGTTVDSIIAEGNIVIGMECKVMKKMVKSILCGIVDMEAKIVVASAIMVMRKQKREKDIKHLRLKTQKILKDVRLCCVLLCFVV